MSCIDHNRTCPVAQVTKCIVRLLEMPPLISYHESYNILGDEKRGGLATFPQLFQDSYPVPKKT
jgi:hypothetical protein